MMQNYVLKFMVNSENEYIIDLKEKTIDKAIWTASYPHIFIKILPRFGLQVRYNFCFTK